MEPKSERIFLVLMDQNEKRRIALTLGEAQRNFILGVLSNVEIIPNTPWQLLVDFVKNNPECIKKVLLAKDHYLDPSGKLAAITARLLGTDAAGKEVFYPASLSDAIALAIGASIPIYVDRELFDEYGFGYEDERKDCVFEQFVNALNLPTLD